MDQKIGNQTDMEYKKKSFTQITLLLTALFGLGILSCFSHAADTDQDGLEDSFETNTGIYISSSDTGTDPTQFDTDDDGYSDGVEVSLGSHPLKFTDTPVQKKLSGSNVVENDYFSQALAADRHTIVAGGYDKAGGNYPGAAYMFEQGPSGWSESIKLEPSGFINFGTFGHQIAVSGEIMIVGVRHDNTAAPQAGAAFVFRRIGSAWAYEATLTASDAEADDAFGSAVTTDGSRVFVGAQIDNSARGAVYVFNNTGSAWVEVAKLITDGGEPNERFGRSLAVDSNTLVIGAVTKYDKFHHYWGAAYIFSRDEEATLETWVQQAKLTPASGHRDDQFGTAVAISGDTVAIGAPFDDSAGSSNGAVYVYSRSGDSWAEEIKLHSNDPYQYNSRDNFGNSLGIDGNVMVIGASGDDDSGNGAGAAYSFIRFDGGWQQLSKFSPNDNALGNNFGYFLAFNDDTAVISSFGDDTLASNAGAAYVFDLDVDNDGLLDAAETNTSTYVDQSNTGTNPFVADSDDDGLLDGFEISIGTNPVLSDSDGDSFSDGEEVASGFDPLHTEVCDVGAISGASLGGLFRLHGHLLGLLIVDSSECDINHDGTLDISDILQLQKLLLRQ